MTILPGMNVCDPEFRVSGLLELPDNEVHLWRLDLNALAVVEDRWKEVLSVEEQMRAARFLAPLARRHFVLTRALLRMLVGGYLNEQPTAVKLRFSAREKPGLDQPQAESKLEFNISHSGGVSLLAFTRAREIGVDVELVRKDRDVDGIARRFFSLAEQKQLETIPAEEKYEAFFRCWTRKEAYIKACGEGLSLPLSQFDVSLAAGAQDALLATRPDNRETARWSLREVPAGAGHVGALCVAGHDWRLRAWTKT